MDGREKETHSGKTKLDNEKQHHDVKIAVIAVGTYHKIFYDRLVWSWG